MIKVDIISGFLGAGKTTLIKKLFSQAFGNEKIVLIENEFGEIGIDGAFLKDAGVNIKEINSGCICCSLVGNFEDAMKEVVATYSPDRIIIEPSGVGKLSDIVKAVQKVDDCGLSINIVATVVDGGKVKMYSKNFGEFYNDQVLNANTIVVSKTDKISEEKTMESYAILREMNAGATIITTPITELNGQKILDALEDNISLVQKLLEMVKSEHHCCCGHHHHDHEHHHDHDDDCCCHDHEHHHDHDGECCCHDHEHHHDHDGECCCHDHEHHHDHDDECCCHDHDHHHDHDDECCCHDHEHHHDHDGECCCGHHHHHADEVFTSWGKETVKSYSKRELETILTALASGDYGQVLRSKGILKSNDGEKWYYFDFVAGDWEIREGDADIMGRAVVIGSEIDEQAIDKLFG